METLYTRKAPEPIGPYSQAKKAGGFLFCSGQIGLDPATGALPAGGVAEETRQVCENVAALLTAAGTSPAGVVRTTCYLVHPEDFAAFNATYAAYFKDAPARSCVFVAALPKGALVEIEATALLPTR